MRTILVVDDDPVSVRLIQLIATRNGYATEPASSAAQALAWLDTAESVSMIITDQRMDGMTGLEFFAAVHADVRFRHVPFILCTGLADRATVEEAVRLGIRHFVVKPITPKVVMEKVAAVEAERPRVLEPKATAMARLGLGDTDYRSLLRESRQHIIGLRDELALAHKSGDRVTAIMVAERLREPAMLLNAARLLAAIDVLNGTRTWHDLESSLELVFEQIGALDDALEVESKPHLIGRSMGSLAP